MQDITNLDDEFIKEVLQKDEFVLWAENTRVPTLKIVNLALSILLSCLSFVLLTTVARETNNSLPVLAILAIISAELIGQTIYYWFYNFGQHFSLLTNQRIVNCIYRKHRFITISALPWHLVDSINKCSNDQLTFKAKTFWAESDCQKPNYGLLVKTKDAHKVQQIATEKLRNLGSLEFSKLQVEKHSPTIAECFRSLIKSSFNFSNEDPLRVVDFPATMDEKIIWSHVPSRWNLWKMIGLWAWTGLGALVVTASEHIFGVFVAWIFLIVIMVIGYTSSLYLIKHAYVVTNKGIVVCRTGLFHPRHDNVLREGFHHAVKLTYEQMFPAQFYINLVSGDGQMNICELENSLSLYLFVDKEMKTLYKLATEGCMLENVQV